MTVRFTRKPFGQMGAGAWLAAATTRPRQAPQRHAMGRTKRKRMEARQRAETIEEGR